MDKHYWKSFQLSNNSIGQLTFYLKNYVEFIQTFSHFALPILIEKSKELDVKFKEITQNLEALKSKFQFKNEMDNKISENFIILVKNLNSKIENITDCGLVERITQVDVNSQIGRNLISIVGLLLANQSSCFFEIYCATARILAIYEVELKLVRSQPQRSEMIINLPTFSRRLKHRVRRCFNADIF